MEINIGRLHIETGGQRQVKETPPGTGKEIGASGTPVFSKMLYETEYNSDLRGDLAIKTYDKMRRSDGQVKAALLACKLPLFVARWDMAPASDDPLDIEVAAKVKTALFDGMDITFDSFLWHTLLMLDFGFMAFEKVWELRDGIYVWKKLAPRLPASLLQWYFDDNDELDYVEQWATKGNKYETIKLPASKLVVFTHEREGNNYRGISLLRAAYKHWWYKNTLYAIDGIAAERHGVGLAYFTFPDNATTEQKNYINAVGQRLHAHERAYVALPESIKFQLLGVQGQLHDIKGSIEHHDVMIVRSVLAQFINVGAREIGSYALSNDQSRFFLFALQATSRNICDTVNRNIIPEMVDYNWDTGGRYPKLTASGLDNPEIAAYAAAIASLATSGMLKPDIATENELRRTIKLPLREKPVETGPGQEPPAGGIQPGDDAGLTDRRAAEGRFWRQPVGVEKVVAFGDIEDKLEKAGDAFVRAVKPIQERQIKSLVGTVEGYVKDKQYDRLAEIDVPYRKQVADAIDDLLKELMDFGAGQVREEAKRQGSSMKAQDKDIDQPEPDAFIHVRALAIAAILANRLRASMAWEALRQVRGGAFNRAALASTLTGLSDSELEKTAKFSTTEAMNLGRQEQAKADEDEIERVQSSAILDSNTCPYCRSMDGKEWRYGEQPEPPPYKDCEGQDRCRCVHIYIYRGEV